jgi:hypothetical protein
MSKYLITYHAPQMPNDPAIMEQAKMAFGKWLQEAGKSVVDPGTPIHPLTQVSNGSSSDLVAIGGFSIIEATSKEEAIKILQSHPYVARGGALQINEMMGI